MTDAPGPRPIRLPPIEMPRPHRLQRLANELTRRAIAKPREDILQKARTLLRSALSGQPVDVGRPRLARALVALLDENRSAAARTKIAALVLESGLGRARDLFVLWQEVRETRAQTTTALQELIGRRAGQQSSHLLGFLPPWISRTDVNQRHDALMSPDSAFLPHLHGRRRTVGELDDALGGVLPGSDLGIALMTQGLKAAPARWWTGLGAPPDVRAWAKFRHERIQAAVAERQLLAIRSQALNVITLPDEPEAQELTRWILEVLGDPEDYPARWQDVSDDARQVFEWLLVRNELLKILAAFRRGATKRERAEFWAGYASQMQDARYLELAGTAVCMMVIKNLFVIEFGDIGNAAYIYEKPGGLPRLRRLKNLPRQIASYKIPSYKTRPHYRMDGNRPKHRLGGHDFFYVDRIIHRAGWTHSTHDVLRRASRGAVGAHDRRAAAHVGHWASEHLAEDASRVPSPAAADSRAATNVQKPRPTTARNYFDADGFELTQWAESGDVEAQVEIDRRAAKRARRKGIATTEPLTATPTRPSQFGQRQDGGAGTPGPTGPKGRMIGADAAGIAPARSSPEPVTRPAPQPTPVKPGHKINQLGLRYVRARVERARVLIARLEALEQNSNQRSRRRYNHIHKREQAELERVVAAAQDIASTSRLPGLSISLKDGHVIIDDPNGLMGSGGGD